MAVWGGLTNSCEKREAKRKGEKERYKHLNVELQRIARSDKKAYLSDQCKEIEEIYLRFTHRFQGKNTKAMQVMT